MFEDAISLLSPFTSLNSWLTPTVLFLFLNLMIGTIALTSGGFSSHKPNHHHHHIHHPQPILHHHHHPQPILHPHQHHVIHHPQPPTLTPSPSVLQRLKSTINFSSFYSHQPHFQPQLPPPQQPEPEPEPEPELESKVEDNTASNDDDEGLTLDEVYSRIKQVDINHPHYGRQNSDTKPSNGESPVKLPQKMKKSASDKSAFSHFQLQDETTTTTTTQYLPTKIQDEILDNYINNDNVDENAVGAAIMKDDKDEADVEEREEEEEEGVDAKADDFINRFKKQLQLQRNESMLRQL